METIPIPGRADGRFQLWLAAGLALATLLGVGGILWTQALVADLETLADEDLELAIATAGRWLRGVAATGALVMTALAGLLAVYFRRGWVEARLPPSGVWSLGATRAVVGRDARLACALGLALTLVLVAASLLLVVLAWRLVDRLGTGA